MISTSKQSRGVFNMGNFGKELREAMIQLVMQEKGLTREQVEEALLKRIIKKDKEQNR